MELQAPIHSSGLEFSFPGSSLEPQYKLFCMVIAASLFKLKHRMFPMCRAISPRIGDSPSRHKDLPDSSLIQVLPGTSWLPHISGLSPSFVGALRMQGVSLPVVTLLHCWHEQVRMQTTSDQVIFVFAYSGKRYICCGPATWTIKPYSDMIQR